MLPYFVSFLCKLTFQATVSKLGGKLRNLRLLFGRQLNIKNWLLKNGVQEGCRVALTVLAGIVSFTGTIGKDGNAVRT